MKALGRHILVEYYDCDPVVLNDLEHIEASMKEAAVKSGSTVVDSIFQRFHPHGISGVVVIAESHLAIHTWPEHCYAAVDLFTCGENVDPWTAYRVLYEAFVAGDSQSREILRGEGIVLGGTVAQEKAAGFGAGHRPFME